MWNKCPKIRFCGRVKLLLAVSQTIAYFNTGAGSKASLLKSVGVNPGINTIISLRKSDKERVKHAAKNITEKARLIRRKKRAKSKTETEKKDYFAGSFGLGKEAETLVNLKKRKASVPKTTKKLNVKKQRTDEAVPLKFVNDLDVIMITYIHK